jgi:molecular chaperone DnaK (HSP70)
VAYCDRGNYPVVSFANESGDAVESYPSVVAERKGELRFGFEAEQVGADAEWTVLRSFKRLLGERSPEATLQIGSTRLRLADLLSRFLSSLAEALRTRSNLAAAAMLEPNEPLEVFVAAPANAASTQRFVSLASFRRAGFDVLGLLNEPSAAGFEYTHRYRSTLTAKKDHVVVYDIGGGTFDVSLLRMSGPHHEVVATSGINRLGGDDFDEELLKLALSIIKVKRSTLSARIERILLEQCRHVKEQLHPSSRRITVDLTAIPKTGREVSVEVGTFYERCAPLIERTVAAVNAILSPSDGSKAAPELAGIYVVGGASSLPCVARTLRDTFGKKVHRSSYPSAAAAIGLAIAADDSAGLKLSDRFSRVFGVFREGEAGAEVTFDAIFDQEVLLPDAKQGPAIVERTYRAAHNIGHFRYVECSAVDTSGHPRGDMARFADIYFPFDPHLREGKAELGSISVRRFGMDGPLIRETYAVGAQGIVEVRIANLDDQYEMAYRLAPSASA